ncbi:helix-turn-helix domain-containing protein [Kitasatospora cathayae]|uniref:Helix-turn-helix transcriptional regulator n=1 Tax=Kitasatospora cathayae TaxID=3004092 RepID=A0ABY7QA88_9ACTN|nr:helix-turn-helix transcriptional regulator [Kitasatospora sp. HUAS 3-15]WBP89471.1 helix-turn-helix transcriptional regulator [Kitasatospora sp. HUAS 3-15]
MPERSTVEVDGPAIRRIRKHAGVDMSTLAEQVGITANYLSRIETGTRRRVRPSVYAALRRHLGAADDELLAPGEARTQRT